MQLLNGKSQSDTLLARYQVAVNRLKQKNITPKLVVITVGEDPASKVYVGQKQKKALQVGMDFEWVKLPEETTQATLNAQIEHYNQDARTHGMIVQFPLPAHLDKFETLAQIAPEKDVDGFHPENVGKLALEQGVLYPCTPKGVVSLLKAYGIRIEGQDIAVIGRSHVVGLPLSILLANMGGTVSICSRNTKDITKFTKDADIVVVAAGSPGLVGADHVKEGVVVVDVGINRLSNGKLVGDVRFDEVKEKASFITPVPGGIGPMTVAMLLEQTILCACLQNHLDLSDFLESE
ncbi:bifunctional 5,10-methylenetetrahydrofolate dehydrogenase/5,10-methenyltetrahydrofolate cyclohydrolase [Aerococcaceae bacterium NML190938]|nr:bifunctional 5,10-methylenetetrahydrofolate dehydrogenase/5,10-methenyltetrahydrofolate cyclohydrolase [Aerococcaceae bacterium NML190938]